MALEVVGRMEVAESEQVDINKAGIVELQRIVHIGEKRARKILTRRPYRDIYELSNVLGLGRKRMADIIRQNIAVVR